MLLLYYMTLSVSEPSMFFSVSHDYVTTNKNVREIETNSMVFNFDSCSGYI